MMQDSSDFYSAPASELHETAATEPEIIPAGKWRRFFNFLIDYVGQVVVVIAGIAVAFLIGGDPALAYVEEIPELMLGMLAALVYYIGMEGLFGRTLGKLITGTRVVDSRGERASIGQVVGRTFARFIPFEAFSFLGETGRGWHDSMSNTYVVVSKDY